MHVRIPRPERSAVAASASSALRAALAELPRPASPESSVAMLADARGDSARPRHRADAHPPLATLAATTDFTERDNAPQLEPSTLQRFRSRDRIADNGDDANAPVNVDSLRLNAAHCRQGDSRVALTRVRFPRAGRHAPATSASLALRAALTATVLADAAGNTCADATAAREGHLVGISRSWTAPKTEFVHHLNPTDTPDFRACRACIGRVSPALRRIARAMRSPCAPNGDNCSPDCDSPAVPGLAAGPFRALPLMRRSG